MAPSTPPIPVQDELELVLDALHQAYDAEEHPRALTISVLAERTGLTKPDVYETLTFLIAEGRALPVFFGTVKAFLFQPG